MSRTVGKAQRLNLLREELRRRPRGVVELARRHGTSRRTIERDLVTLSEQMGEQLLKDDSHRWYIPNRTPGLNEVEALAVYSATRLLLHTGVGERHYRTALEKLAQQVPEPARAGLLKSVDRLAAAPEDRVLDQVAQAWFQRRVLKCRYLSANSGNASTRELEVYFYEINRRNLEPYVLAFDRSQRRRVLVFKLARMSDVRLLDETYEIPTDFDPNSQLNSSFGIMVGEEVQIDLRVPENVARRMAEGGDRNLSLGEKLPGAKRMVHVIGTLDDSGKPLELLPWLLSWGSSIEVMSPPEVRQQMREHLQQALCAYQEE